MRSTCHLVRHRMPLYSVIQFVKAYVINKEMYSIFLIITNGTAMRCNCDYNVLFAGSQSGTMRTLDHRPPRPPQPNLSKLQNKKGTRFFKIRSLTFENVRNHRSPGITLHQQ